LAIPAGFFFPFLGQGTFKPNSFSGNRPTFPFIPVTLEHCKNLLTALPLSCGGRRGRALKQQSLRAAETRAVANRGQSLLSSSSPLTSESHTPWVWVAHYHTSPTWMFTIILLAKTDCRIWELEYQNHLTQTLHLKNKESETL
jgi:hypothetical protein